MALAGVQLLGGCAGTGEPAAPAIAEARTLQRGAPTATEMESPLALNGETRLPRRGTAADSPVVDESITMRTEELHGYAFPGAGAPAQPVLPAAPETPEVPDTPPAAPGPDAAQLARLESRLQAMERTLSELDQPSPTAVMESPEVLQAQYDELRAQIAALEGRQDQLAQTVPQVLSERLQEMEAKLAELEGRPVEVIEARPEDLERRFEEMRAQLAVLERQTPERVEVQTAQEVVEDRMQQMENRIAELEGRPARIVDTTPDNMERRFAEISEKLASLEQRPVTVVQETPEDLTQRMAEISQQLAALEQRPATVVQETPEELERRVAEMSMQLAALETQESPEVLEQRVAAVERALSDVEAGARGMDMAVTQVEHIFAELREEMLRLQEDVRTTQAATPETPDTTEPIFAPVPAPQPPSAPAPFPAAPTADLPVSYYDPAGYRIGAGDILEFTSFNDEMLDREVTVRYDGYISLPLIPDVRVAGLSRPEAEARIEEAYRTQFRNPQVSLIIRDALSKLFTVVGDIQEPGLYPYEQPIRLIDAISQAGGLRQRTGTAGTGGGFVGITGQLVKAFVIRQEDGARGVLEYDLRNLGTPGHHDSEAPVFPGDIIYIPEGVNLVYLLGEADNRVVELTQGMRLLHLLSLAGGFDASTARLNQVVLMREVDSAHTEIMLVNLRQILRNPNLDVTLNPGDIVYIPQRRLVRLEEFVGRFTGSISPVLGLYNDYITARYSRRISEQLLREENGALRTLGVISNITGATSGVLDLIGRP